jgi:hypothetical protein
MVFSWKKGLVLVVSADTNHGDWTLPYWTTTLRHRQLKVKFGIKN